MGLAYSLKCSLLCSYFYSLAPLLSFSFSHILAPRVSLIPPGHITSGSLHRPFHLDISHPELFITHSTRTSRIRNSSRRHSTRTYRIQNSSSLHSTRTYHIRNPSPPPFHPDGSHPESFSAAIPPGCLTSEILPRDIPPGCLISGILLRRHSTRISHVRNPIRPTSHLLRISRIWNPA